MISPRTQKILASQRTNAIFPCLIKITHADFPDMYFANSSQDINYNGNIYNAATFELQPPEHEGPRIGNATLTISAIDQFWIQRIREIQTPAELQFIAAIIHEESGSFGIDPLEENLFTLRTANWNELSLSWDLSFDERMGYIITSTGCTPMIAPGCA